MNQRHQSFAKRIRWNHFFQEAFGQAVVPQSGKRFNRVVPQLTLLEDRTVPAGTLGAFNALPQVGSLVYQANGGGSLGSTVASDGFESGSLGAAWSTYSSTANGRIQVTGAYGTASGSYALLMDTTVDGDYNLNEAVLTVNLAGQSNATLQFSHAVFNDEPETFFGDFIDHAFADGVAVSNDGVNWHPIFDAPSGFAGWQNVSIDLAAAISGSGLTLNDSTFLIKFQQFDNFQLTTDGRGWDDIRINKPGSADTIPLSLDPGQTLNLSVDGGEGMLVSARLLSGSTVVATATASSPGGQAVFPQVRLPGKIADGTPGIQNFTLEISNAPANLGSYSVRAVLNAANEGESSNDTTGTAQNLESSFVQLHRGNAANPNGPLPARAAVLGTVDDISANVPEQEPNNPPPPLPPDLFLYAQNIDIGEWITGIDPYFLTETSQLTVNGTGDGTFDYYAFTIPDDFAPGSITITSDFGYAAFFVFDSFGNWWIYGDEFSPSGLDFMSAGTYFLGVGTIFSTVGNGELVSDPPPIGSSYSLFFSVTDHVTTVGGSGVLDELEPNQPPVPPRPNLLLYAQNLDDEQWVKNGDPVVTDSAAIPHVSVIGDGDDTFDYYSFTVNNAGDRGIFDIDFENFDSMIFLYDADGNVLAISDDNGGDPGSGSVFASYIDYTFASPGQYVIAVGTFYCFDSNGQLNGSPVFFGEEYTLHVSIQDKAFVSPGPDVYSLQLSAGDSAAVTVSRVSASGNLQVELLNASGSVVATGSSSATNVASAIASYHATASGTYYVRVTGVSNTEYNLLVTRNATVELEGNSTLATAQGVYSPQVAGRHWITGAINPFSGTLQAIDSGWYDSFGFHDPFNTNYFAGQVDSTRQLNDFVVFNTGAINGTVVSAQLQLFNPGGATPGYLSADPTETYALFDVSTPISALLAGGFGLTGIFSDLGTGTSFGSRVVSSADNGTLITFNLNAAGLAALGAAGGQFALGGALTTLAGNLDLARIFGFTSAAVTRQLVVSTSDTDFYAISADANAMLEIDATAPAAGAGDFVNTLQPVVRLYNSAGALVATGNTGSIKYKVPKNAGGSYTVEVSGGNGSRGEYILSIKGDRENSSPASPSFIFSGSGDVQPGQAITLPSLPGAASPLGESGTDNMASQTLAGKSRFLAHGMNGSSRSTMAPGTHQLQLLPPQTRFASLAHTNSSLQSVLVLLSQQTGTTATWQVWNDGLTIEPTADAALPTGYAATEQSFIRASSDLILALTDLSNQDQDTASIDQVFINHVSLLSLTGNLITS